MNNNLELKVNTIIDALLSNTDEGYDNAMAKLRELRNAPVDETVHNIDSIIEQMLLDVGVPSNLVGHKYLMTAIEFCTAYVDNHPPITKVIYPEVAKRYNTTATRVERGIRHAIDVAWNRTSVSTLTKYFGNTTNPTSYKLSNSEFIWRLANVANRKLQEG